MAFNGKWRRTDAVNGLALLTYMGVSKEKLEALKGVDTFLEITQNGDSVDEIRTIGPKVTKHAFKMGQKCQITTMDETIVDITPVAVGTNKYKVEYDHKGVHLSAVRELINENQFVDNIDLDNGKVVGKFIYTRF